VLTSSQSGLTVFDSALVRQLNFIRNAYANLIQFPAPLTAAASATAATSPILTDFVVMRTGDPTADVFVHGLPSTAPGLSDRPEIRMGTTKFISAGGGSGGSGTTAVEIRQEMDANSTKLAAIVTQTNKLTFTNTGRVDATAITVANNAITAASIATDAITSSGLAASAVTEIQSGLASQNSVSAIPTNPLLTSDTRLNNLNAPIGSIPTNPLLTSDTRLNNLNAPVGSIPTNPLLTNDARLDNLDAAVSSRLASTGYTAPDNAGVSSLNTKLTTTRAGNLDNLDAAISSRSTASDIPTATQNASAVRTNLTTELGRVDAAISTRSSHTAADTWSVGTRSLTDKAGFSLSTAGVQAIWDNTTRTLSSFGTLSGDTATAVWAATTRSLTTFGTLTTDIWAVATRTITARPPSTASDTDLTAVKAKTDAIVITSGRVESVIDATLLAKEETVQAIPNAEENASAVRTNLTTELGRLDANVSSRSNHTADNVWAVATRSLTDKTGFSLSAAGVQAVWEYATRTLTTFGSLAADVWTATTRTITTRPPNTASDTDVAALKRKLM
jgi:hypothetical protein